MRVRQVGAGGRCGNHTPHSTHRLARDVPGHDHDPLGRTERALHLHHWLVYAVLLPWLAPWPVAWGAALTLVVQGLLYQDCLHFVVPRPADYPALCS